MKSEERREKREESRVKREREREGRGGGSFLLSLHPSYYSIIIIVVRALLINYFVWDDKGNDLNG